MENQSSVYSYAAQHQPCLDGPEEGEVTDENKNVYDRELLRLIDIDDREAMVAGSWKGAHMWGALQVIRGHGCLATLHESLDATRRPPSPATLRERLSVTR